jgi:3-hydroxyacyl-[acyl-carrier-protein] dehydratase
MSLGTGRPQNVYLTIDKAKFRKPVVPGDTIEYHDKDLTAPEVVVPRRSQVAGTLVAEAEVAAMIADR